MASPVCASNHECKATSRASLNTVAGTYMDTNMYYIRHRKHNHGYELNMACTSDLLV